ncbi:MAG: hypothetical protein BAJALOKI3v1_820022, partial [Promethearchaeota archaeon]
MVEDKIDYLLLLFKFLRAILFFDFRSKSVFWEIIFIFFNDNKCILYLRIFLGFLLWLHTM